MSEVWGVYRVRIPFFLEPFPAGILLCLEVSRETMKALLQKTIRAALFSLCFTVAAQETIYSTAKDAFVVLTAVVQKPDGGTNKVRITNKDVFAALNATNAFDFDNHAKLLLRSVNGGLFYFVVREPSRNVGTNSEVDVSEFLTL